MTRSVTIVNTSNWDGEDYIIRERNKNNENATPVETRIKPGESKQVSPDYIDIEFEAADSKEPEPFELNGQQVFPFVISSVGINPNSQSG